MFTIVATAIATPSVNAPVRDCIGHAIAKAARPSTAVRCSTAVRDAAGELRGVFVQVHVGEGPNRLTGWLTPSESPLIHEATHGDVPWWDRAWQYDGGRIYFVRMANHGTRTYRTSISVYTDDPETGVALAGELADGVRLAWLEDGPLTPYEEADTWVDLPTHDCHAMPELVPTGRVGVRCHTVFPVDRERDAVVSYEVSRPFAEGAPVSVDAMAVPGALARWDVHQGHLASDRIWTDASGAHLARVVPSREGDVAVRVTVHGQADEDARALAGRVARAVDVRALR